MIKKKTVFITTQHGIPLGRQGENDVTQIVFPQPEELLSQNWTLIHQRPGDVSPYPVSVDMSAQGVIWNVTSGDTAENGTGEAQLICTGPNGEVLKSFTYITVVSKSLCVPGEPPDPVKPWYEKIMEQIGQGGVNVTELDALAALMDTGVVDPMADENGAVYVDEAGNLYSY